MVFVAEWVAPQWETTPGTGVDVLCKGAEVLWRQFDQVCALGFATCAYAPNRVRALDHLQDVSLEEITWSLKEITGGVQHGAFP